MGIKIQKCYMMISLAQFSNKFGIMDFIRCPNFVITARSDHQLSVTENLHRHVSYSLSKEEYPIIYSFNNLQIIQTLDKNDYFLNLVKFL